MATTGWGTDVDLCPPDPTPRRAALGVLYRRVPDGLRDRLIEEALAEADAGQIDLSGLWLARRGRRVVGAMLTQPLAGLAAAVWAPEVDAAWNRRRTAVALVRAALADLKARGFRLAQALLDESAPRHAAGDLAGGGMPRVTDLVYLEADTARPIPVRPGTPAVEWAGFGAEPAGRADLRTVLHQTYVGSLDMPELEGLRSLDDVIAGHRAAGRFVPERWRVGHVRGEPDAGLVVLLSEVPDRDIWEVAYLGLTPSARGRGLGLAALAHATELARPHATRLELAVDVRNVPARRLYQAAGLSAFDRRAVHIVTLG